MEAREMEKTILKLKTNRIAARQFNVTIDDGNSVKERLFDDASAVYASHVMLREYVIENAGKDIELYTNANNLIADVQAIEAGNTDKRLTQILHKTLEQYDVNIIKVAHIATL